MSQDLHGIAILLESSVAKERQQGIVMAVRGNHSGLKGKITDLAGSDPDQETRYLARKGLERMQQAAEPLDSEADKFSAVDIEKLFNSADPHARFAGLKKVLAQKSDTGRFMLLNALSHESMPQIRASLVIGVGHFGKSEDVAILAPYLKDEDSRVRANTVEALAMIASEDAYRHIISAMHDDDNRVKTNVVKALQEIGGPSLFNLLKKMAEDPRLWMRASAVHAFTRIKSPQSLMVLAKIAHEDTDEGIRGKALQAIRIEKTSGNPAAAVILDKLEASVTSSAVTITEAILEPGSSNDIRKLLAGAEPARRYIALARLGQTDFADLVDVFIAAFEREEDYFLVAMMLNLVRDKKLLPGFNRARFLLNHKDERVRANAVEALAAIDLNRAAEFLLPLLEDKDCRVVGNAVLALKQAARLEAFVELKKMIGKGRESFKLSALYVMRQVREPMIISLLEKLIRDPNPRLRDKAFEVLQFYAADKIPGAASLKKDVEKQIELERNRDSFFENSLDAVFSGLLKLLKAKKDAELAMPAAIPFERNPQAERAALLQLADKCLQQKLVDSRTVESLEILSKELETVESLIVEAVKPLPGAAAPLEESAHQMTEEQLLGIEKTGLLARREGILAAFAFDYFKNRAFLDIRTAALLRVELGRVEGSLCSFVPEQAFSMLPGEDSAVSEIFDVTMRLYQKHVYTFSIKTIQQFARWAIGALVISFGYGAFAELSPIIGIVFLLIFIPYYSYKSLAMLIQWKIMVALMVDDYIRGREPNGETIATKTEALFKSVFESSVKKHLLLGLWLILATGIGGVIFYAGGMFGKSGFLFSVATLLAVLVGIIVMATVYFKFILIEPLAILAPGKEPFEIAEKFYQRDRIKISSLYIFATFIMAIITGTSTAIMTFFMPVLPQALSIFLVQLLTVLSEICLAPIVFSNIVVYCLMNLKNGESV